MKTIIETTDKDTNTTTWTIADTMSAKFKYATAIHTLAEESVTLDLEAKCRIADALAVIANALTAHADND